jgi:hypothetical protein
VDEQTERRALIAISAATIASGGLQAALPDAVLRPLRARDDATARHLFGTIGMFMVCVGGTLLDALLRRSHERGTVLWAALQKLGAAGAVAIGVKRRIFAPLALAVASFDLLSGLLALDYWRRTRR